VIKRVGLSVAGVLVGLGSAAIVRRDPAASLAGATVVHVAALLVVGWLLIGVGIWLVRGAGGPQLAAAGFAWFITEWNNPAVGSSVAFTIGLIGYAACPAFVADGTLAAARRERRSAMDRAAIGMAYFGSLVVFGLAPALFFEPGAQGCSDCAANLVAMTSVPRLVGASQHLGVWFGVMWSAALALVAMRRLVRSSAAARRASAPLLVPLTVYLVVIALGYVHAVGDGEFVVDQTAQQLWTVQAVALLVLSVGFFAGAIRARRARHDVARVVVALAAGREPGVLRRTLARTLADPDLQIAYPLSDGRHVDDRGAAVNLAPAKGRATTAVVREGRTVAVLMHSRELLDDPRLVAEATNAAALALEHERLLAEVSAQLVQLRHSFERLVAGADAELQCLGRDLHDGAQQALVGALFELRLLRSRVEGQEPDTAVHLEAADTELLRVLDVVRTVASSLHPAVLSDYGLVAAIGALGERSGSPIRLRTVTDDRFPPDVESAVYRAVVASAQTGPVTVDLARHNDRLVLDIEAAVPPPDLGDVRDRVRALDGQLDIEPQAAGSHLRVVIPCA
jgi:signal transduction histidine kinase